MTAIKTLDEFRNVRRSHVRTTLKIVLLLAAAVASLQPARSMFAAEATAIEQVVESFDRHLRELDVAGRDDALEIFNEIREQSPVDAVTESLMVAYPRYAVAMRSADEDSADAATKLAPLTRTGDPFLAADASFMLARTLINREDYEQAITGLEMLKNDLREYSVHASVTDYFLGLAQAGMLDSGQAIESFQSFLNLNKDAPERMRVSAWRQLQRLEAIEDGKLTDIHQRMNFSRRRLELENTDQSTQEQQQKIVAMLSKLIHEEEKKEASSSGKNTKDPQKKQQPKPQQTAGGDKPKPGSSEGQEGGGSKVPNGDAVVKNYDDAPASPWSRLRERSRDPANNAIKSRLPARYRDLVERYMEAANSGLN